MAPLQAFFESLLPYLDRPPHVSRWRDYDFDNFRFIVHELFLHLIAQLLKAGRFDAISYLLDSPYYVPEMAGQSQSGGLVTFGYIRQPVRSLAARNERLGLGRLSPQADLIKNRSVGGSVNFSELVQTDFILFIRDAVDCLRSSGWQWWWPITSVYSYTQHGPFPFFARARSARYFAQTKRILGVESKEELGGVLEAFKSEKLRMPGWDYFRVPISTLMGFDGLASQP